MYNNFILLILNFQRFYDNFLTIGDLIEAN